MPPREGKPPAEPGKYGGLTHKQIVCLGTVSSHSEELHEIVELPVDITTNLTSHRQS